VTRELPETVKSTIARKLDRLDETDRRLLTTAAIQGYEFDTLVLSDVLALDPADVEERMDAIASTHHLARNIGTVESVDPIADGAISLRPRSVSERALRLRCSRRAAHRPAPRSRGPSKRASAPTTPAGLRNLRCCLRPRVSFRTRPATSGWPRSIRFRSSRFAKASRWLVAGSTP
jgi:hypothetical protein